MSHKDANGVFLQTMMDHLKKETHQEDNKTPHKTRLFHKQN